MAYQETVRNVVRGPWWVPLLEGIAALIVGFLLLIAPGMTTLVLIQILGIYWLVVGIISIVRIFIHDGSVAWGWLLFNGIVGILAGLVIIRHPVVSTVFIPTLIIYFLGFAGLFMGISNIVQGARGVGWWAVALGILDILIGLLLIFNPLVSAVALPFVIGVIGLVAGCMLIYYAFKQRSRGPSIESLA